MHEHFLGVGEAITTLHESNDEEFTELDRRLKLVEGSA